MKKEGTLIAVLLLISIFAITGAFALNKTASIQKAYTCLNNKIDSTNCSKMGLEEKIFSLLSVGKCKTELLQSSRDKTCWPSSGCDLKKTSEAVIALNKVGVNTSLPVKWILSKKGLSKDLNWYLEIDSNGPLTCSVGYRTKLVSSGSYENYNFNIGADKKINQSAGPCLTRSNNNFWFAISPNCYDSEFQISCKETFISTLLYKEKNSPTYHISENTQSSSGGTTIEKINSYCFLSGESCDYSGTLWATTALDYLGYNFSSFLPYLSTLSQNYQSLFPQTFLYILTNRLEYKTEIFNRQTLEGYWNIFGGKGPYYDTALALLPFQGKELTKKTNAKNWLFNKQQANGCWDNDNIVSNAFLLFSIWPPENPVVKNKNLTCSESGNTCVTNSSQCISGFINSKYSCADSSKVCCDTTSYDDSGNYTCSEVGNTCVNDSSQCSGTIDSQYSCADSSKVCCDTNSSDYGGGNECTNAGYTCGFSSSCNGKILSDLSCGQTIEKCCDSSQEQKTCEDAKGTVCSSNEYCSGGNTLDTYGLKYGETCCIGIGTCKTKESTDNSTCEVNLGYCSSSCDSGDVENSNYTCSNSGDVCCFQSNNKSNSGKSYLWIWILFFLILITVIGIVYRNKLKELIQKFKARRNSSNGRGTNSGRGIPPRFPPGGYRRSPRIGSPPIRKMIPLRPPQKFIPKKRSSKELDEVLKKLKEIGK